MIDAPTKTTTQPGVEIASPGSEAARAFRERRIACWNRNAHAQPGPAWNRYHPRLVEVYRSLVMPGQRVLEIGCGQGDLLTALQPQLGVGVDFSPEMLAQARARHPHLHFVQADAHDLQLSEAFDVIILSDLVNDLWDVQQMLQQVRKLCTPRTRVILNTYSRLWELPLEAARRTGILQPILRQNWLTVDDVAGLLNLADMEVIRHWEEVLWPLPTPIVEQLANRVLAKIPPFNHAALTHMIVARPISPRHEPLKAPRVSVIVPARNESGNIVQVFERLPRMGSETEIVFVEGHSKDDTYQAIEREIAAHPEWRCQLLRQQGKGKADAVRLGFEHATGDVLMILDADLTMPPEDLPRYYEALVTGKAEFVNGVRLVYPMEDEAMRFLNLLGNKFFSTVFSWLIGQPIKDTLCGTKVLWKADYNLIAANRAYFGDFDPFGDFDLIFGAARLNLKIVDMPIRYRERTYGTTNIDRWRHGVLLLRMVQFAARRLKFI